MDGDYAEIYERAKHYLDTRQNDIHTATAYGFARRLVELCPEADEAVVLPAVILHDVGWKMIPEDQQTAVWHRTPGVRDVARPTDRGLAVHARSRADGPRDIRRVAGRAAGLRANECFT